jgi:hypothetical protein
MLVMEESRRRGFMAFPVGVAELALKRLARAPRVGHWVIYIWGAAAPRWVLACGTDRKSQNGDGFGGTRQPPGAGGKKMPACKATKKPPEGGFFDEWLAQRLR